MTALQNKLYITCSEVMKNKVQDYFYVCTVHFVYSFISINNAKYIYFYAFLTVHHSIDFSKYQLSVQFF